MNFQLTGVNSITSFLISACHARVSYFHSTASQLGGIKHPNQPSSYRMSSLVSSPAAACAGAGLAEAGSTQIIRLVSPPARRVMTMIGTL